VYAANGIGAVLAEMGDIDTARKVFVHVSPQHPTFFSPPSKFFSPSTCSSASGSWEKCAFFPAASTVSIASVEKVKADILSCCAAAAGAGGGRSCGGVPAHAGRGHQHGLPLPGHGPAQFRHPGAYLLSCIFIALLHT
jgi:hypothetical protein